MISPENEFGLTMRDLCRTERIPLSGILFDVLFNLHKFIKFETRDPFQERQKREDMHGNDWNRFTALEYHRLAAEEENTESYNNSSTIDMEISESKMNRNEQNLQVEDENSHGDWYLDDEEEDDTTSTSRSFRSRIGANSIVSDSQQNLKDRYLHRSDIMPTSVWEEILVALSEVKNL
eukprot:gene171-295_t